MSSHRIFLSFPRKREARGKTLVARPWATAFAGATKLGYVLIMAVLAACNSVKMPGWPEPAPETAASAAAWTKAGADATMVTSTYNDCLDMANEATAKDFNIDQDIAASRGSDLQRSNFAGTQLRNAQRGTRERTQTILSTCMEQKGFTPAK